MSAALPTACVNPWLHHARTHMARRNLPALIPWARRPLLLILPHLGLILALALTRSELMCAHLCDRHVSFLEELYMFRLQNFCAYRLNRRIENA